MTLGVMALEPEAEETANTDILPAPPGQAEDPPDLESSTLSLSLSEIPPSSRNSTMNTNITPTHDKSALYYALCWSSEDRINCPRSASITPAGYLEHT